MTLLYYTMDFEKSSEKMYVGMYICTQLRSHNSALVFSKRLKRQTCPIKNIILKVVPFEEFQPISHFFPLKKQVIKLGQVAENVPNSTKIRFSATLTLHYSSHSETERLLMAPPAYSKTVNSDRKKTGLCLVNCLILLHYKMFLCCNIAIDSRQLDI